MTRGSKVNIWKYIDGIAPFLSIGMSLERSCVQAGVPRQTVEEYMRKDDEVRRKIMQLKDKGLVTCRQVIFKAAKEGNWRAALAILERKDSSWTPPVRMNIKEEIFDKGSTKSPKEMSLNELQEYFRVLWKESKR